MSKEIKEVIIFDCTTNEKTIKHIEVEVDRTLPPTPPTTLEEKLSELEEITNLLIEDALTKSSGLEGGM